VINKKDDKELSTKALLIKEFGPFFYVKKNGKLSRENRNVVNKNKNNVKMRI